MFGFDWLWPNPTRKHLNGSKNALPTENQCSHVGMSIYDNQKDLGEKVKVFDDILGCNVVKTIAHLIPESSIQTLIPNTMFQPATTKLGVLDTTIFATTEISQLFSDPPSLIEESLKILCGKIFNLIHARLWGKDTVKYQQYEFLLQKCTSPSHIMTLLNLTTKSQSVEVFLLYLIIFLRKNDEQLNPLSWMTDSEIPSMPKVLLPLVAVLELKKYTSMHAGLTCFGKIKNKQ